MKPVKIDFESVFDDDITLDLKSLLHLYLTSYLDFIKDDSFFYKDNDHKSDKSSERVTLIKTYEKALQLVKEGQFDVQFLISKHNNNESDNSSVSSHFSNKDEVIYKKNGKSQSDSDSSNSKGKDSESSDKDSEVSKILKLVKMDTIESKRSNNMIRVSSFRENNNKLNTDSLKILSPIRPKRFSVNFGTLKGLGIMKGKQILLGLKYHLVGDLDILCLIYY
jgi:hypothetical protein